MKKIHTVFGTTGEYSDRTEWAIISYYNEEIAKDHVVNATQRANEWEIEKDTKESWDYDIPEGFNKYDLDMQMDYTGTSYYYVTTIVGDC